jgi:hypothetical protein
MDADPYAAFLVVAVVLALVALLRAGSRSLLAWACLVGFGALAYDAVAWAGWFR